VRQTRLLMLPPRAKTPPATATRGGEQRENDGERGKFNEVWVSDGCYSRTRQTLTHLFFLLPTADRVDNRAALLDGHHSPTTSSSSSSALVPVVPELAGHHQIAM